MEAGTNALSRTSQTDCEQGPGGANRRESSWPVANRKLARPGHCFAECLLCRARASAHGRAVLAQPAEPPYADPHVRWCGRGEWVTTPPMPIYTSAATAHRWKLYSHQSDATDTFWCFALSWPNPWECPFLRPSPW